MVKILKAMAGSIVGGMYLDGDKIDKVLFFNVVTDDENMIVLKTTQDITDLGRCMQELSNKLENYTKHGHPSEPKIIDVFYKAVKDLSEPVREANNLGKDGFAEIRVELENDKPNLVITKLESTPAKRVREILRCHNIKINL